MLLFFISAVALASAASAATLAGIPTVSFELSSDGSLDFSTIATIIVDEKNADAVDTDGLTLIPPTLLDFAGTFAEDLVSVLNFEVVVKVGSAASAGADAIFLTLGNKSDYLDVAGRQTSEGYSLEITAEEGITITGRKPPRGLGGALRNHREAACCELADEYSLFCIELNKFIKEKSGKQVRLWGTFPPSDGDHVDTDVSVQHWAPWEGNPVFDWLANNFTVLNSADAIYIVGKWSQWLPALADKQWGGELMEEEYLGLFEALQPFVPDQNLDRRIPSQGPTILEYDFATGRGCEGKFKDVSGNRYHAASSCGSTDEGIILQEGCEVTTPLSSKGRNYTMSFSIKPTSDAKGPIFTGGDSALWYGNGTVDSVMAWSGDNLYALNYTFPVGEWTNASLIAKGDRTFLDVGEGEPMEFKTILGIIGTSFVWERLAVEAPLKTIGGGAFEGIIGRWKLKEGGGEGVMTTPRPPRVSSGEASIPRGRQAYAEGQYKTAIEHFTLVANACSCNRGGRRDRCKCKDFEKVAQDGASIFKEAMHKCSCDASRKYKKCHEPSHIQALDYRAAVFEKMGRLELAKKDAAWLLEIAPRSLEGYLRMGKVYRLEKEPELALAFWNAGIEVGAKEGHGGSAKLKQLFDARAPLQKRYGRKDPMELPLEIVDNIFSYLDFRELWYVSSLVRLASVIVRPR
ncbi:conserved hypothetical protein [Verticillium alfalfae VaMs.102]|uniref:Uncharacterized protein n=1 Tax=Verticillium alfalfae (strain VaMs.102 / ATCC MYA-4576 / FGSC 10136) TaxID=526221 RepID=C9S576_VERA1|nr:conserved hypothetical protein [Verticillium alfalfae VaMs.102]EEY14176.1 conserved hypothetical protein [Verticillium alfalfae VaMs.102]